MLERKRAFCLNNFHKFSLYFFICNFGSCKKLQKNLYVDFIKFLLIDRAAEIVMRNNWLDAKDLSAAMT